MARQTPKQKKPKKLLPPIEEILDLIDDGWTHAEIAKEYNLTNKHSVAVALSRWRAANDQLVGRTPYRLPFRVPEHIAEKGIWRYLIWNERVNMGRSLPTDYDMDKLMRWREQMSEDGGYVVMFDMNLEPDPEGTPPEKYTSYLGGGYFRIEKRQPEDPVSDDPEKPMFYTLRDKDGNPRTWDEVRAAGAKPRPRRGVNLRGM